MMSRVCVMIDYWLLFAGTEESPARRLSLHGRVSLLWRYRGMGSSGEAIGKMFEKTYYFQSARDDEVVCCSVEGITVRVCP